MSLQEMSIVFILGQSNKFSIPGIALIEFLKLLISFYFPLSIFAGMACPALSKVPHVLVIHGESDGRVECIKRNKPAKWILHKPTLPISFGTHHSLVKSF